MISETTKNHDHRGSRGDRRSAAQRRSRADLRRRRPEATMAVYRNVHARGRRRPLRGVRVQGFVKEEKNGRGWRFGAWGNDAPVMLTYLLRGGLKGFLRGVVAYRLLDKYGNDGEPWGSEIERLRA